jgi:hypothetical protein
VRVKPKLFGVVIIDAHGAAEMRDLAMPSTVARYNLNRGHDPLLGVAGVGGAAENTYWDLPLSFKLVRDCGRARGPTELRA